MPRSLSGIVQASMRNFAIYAEKRRIAGERRNEDASIASWITIHRRHNTVNSMISLQRRPDISSRPVDACYEVVFLFMPTLLMRPGHRSMPGSLLVLRKHPKPACLLGSWKLDRKSTRLNSSH